MHQRVGALLLSVLSGVVYFLGFVGFGYWPLIFLFPVFFLAAIEGRGFWASVGLGALVGFVGMCGGYYWLIGLLQTFADLPLGLAVLGYALLNAYQGLLWGVVGGLVWWARRTLKLSPEWSLPWAVIVATWVYPLLFHSFMAASFFRVPVWLQIADIGGAYAVDGMIAMVAGAIYSQLPWSTKVRGRRFGPLLAGAGLVALTLVYGSVQLRRWDARAAEARTLPVALIQTNLGERDKTEKRALFLERHQRMSRQAIEERPETQLIVWPEAAFNRAILRSTKNVSRYLTVGITRPVLSGALTVELLPEGRNIYNSAILSSSTGDVRAIYDKVRLVAFGEAIPYIDDIPWLAKFLRKHLLPRTAYFQRGTRFAHIALEDGTKLLPMICYEDLLPSQSRELWWADGPPDALINVTNDSWYGDSHEPLIHLALASLRSVESRRSLIRSTNTGLSAVIGPSGRVLRQSGQWTQEILYADVPLIEDGYTPIYLKLGDWLCGLSVLLGLVGVLVVHGRRRKWIV